MHTNLEQSRKLSHTNTSCHNNTIKYLCPNNLNLILKKSKYCIKTFCIKKIMKKFQKDTIYCYNCTRKFLAQNKVK